MDALACWRCEQPGHAYADCTRPPAKTRQELAARIKRLASRWIDGEITRELKRQFAAAEIRAFEKGKAK